jgi:ABC-type bacteriocin/lantibiotic exporter with double-glycine peptidase domain
MLAHFGGEIPAREVRRILGVSRDCVNASNIQRAARSLGLNCSARSLETEDLFSIKLPAVVHIRFIHFVVLESIGRQEVRVNCPSGGILDIAFEQFDQDFTGIVLEMEPGPQFHKTVPSGNSHWLAFVSEAARGSALSLPLFSAMRALGILLLASAATQQFENARISRIRLLEGIILLLASAVASAESLRRWNRATYRALRARLVRRLRNVPFAFFVYRLPDALQGTVAGARNVCASGQGRLAPAVSAVIESILLIAATFEIDKKVALQLAGVFTFWCGLVGFLSLWRRGFERSARSDLNAQQTHLLFDALHHPELHRLGEGPHRLRRALAGSSAALQMTLLDSERANALLGVAPYLLTLLAASVVILAKPEFSPACSFGVILVAGSLGVVARFLGHLRGVFEGSSRKLMAVADVLQEPLEEPAITLVQSAPSDQVVSFDSVTFRFNPWKPPVLAELSFELRAGERLGITGPSGGGKSTLTELLAGLHVPESGEIRIGGVQVTHLPWAERARWIVRIGPRPVVFQATLLENLMLGHQEVSDTDLHAALRDADFERVLDALPEGLSTVLEYQGRNLSGGQLQRLEIARALIRNPRVVILDDALDALDMASETRILEALRRRGCSVLLVGHRAGSLAACDRVLHFVQGKTTETPPTATTQRPQAPRADGLFIFSPHSESSFDDANPPVDVEQLLETWRCLDFGETPADAASELTGLPRVEAIRWLAEQQQMTVRRVHFVVENWKTMDVGRLLAFRHDGTPVAMIAGVGGPCVYDSPTRKLIPLTAPLASTLCAEAYAFLRPQAVPCTNVAQWRRLLLQGAPLDIALVLTSALGASSACITAFVAFSSNSHRVLAPLLLFGACGIFWAAYQTSLHRLRRHLTAQAEVLSQRVALAVDPEASCGWAASELFDSVQGLNNVLKRIQVAFERGSLACGVILATLSAISLRDGGGAALYALTGGLVCASLPAAGAFWGLPEAANHERTGLLANRRLLTLLRGIGRLRLLGAADDALARWATADDQYQRLTEVVERGTNYAAWLALLPATLTSVLAYYQGIRLGDTALVWLLSLAALELGEEWADWIADDRSRRLAERLLALVRGSDADPIVPAQPILAASGLACSYRDSAPSLFQDVTLEVRPNEITVITGPSGCGKSTLLAMLLGFKAPQSGQVLLDGQKLTPTLAVRWHRRVAAVFQGEMLEEAQTIRGQLCSSQGTTVAEMWQALELVEIASEVMAMPMGLQTIVEFGRISNGQQQRLLIARALLMQPSLLVLDEATNAIPDAVQTRILSRLRDRGIGCLIVTHRASVIDVADTVYVIDRSVVFRGTPAELRQKEFSAAAKLEQEVFA